MEHISKSNFLNEMKKNKKIKYDFPIFNEDHTYIISMFKKGESRGKGNIPVENVECKLKNLLNDKSVEIYKEGYESKYIYSSYFEWLLYTNYVKEIK